MGGEILVEKQARVHASGLAMTIVLISFSMLFATMFMGYFLFRINAPVWPPLGMEKIGLFWPNLSTVSIIASSIFYVLFEKKREKNYLFLCTALGFVFMLSQFNLWGFLKEQGYYLSTGIYASLIYGFTWTHAGHIVMALLLLFYLLFKINKTTDEVRLGIVIDSVGKFWHFLGLVWILMYLTLFIF